MQRHTILVVEDIADILKVVRGILSREKTYDVRCATSAVSGLKLGTSLPGPIHLLIANVMLNGTFGSDLAQKLRVARPQMKVILLDGKGLEDIRILDRAVSQGWGLIEKRFIREELMIRVRNELKGAGATG